MFRIRNAPLLLMAAVLMTACGQKGPLYLPEPDPQNEEAREDKEKTKKSRS
ncbi:MAG: lipoprotein [Xanthomonadales bacterium]|nr:lipoprotein [Xanthomonadales bacterium]